MDSTVSAALSTELTGFAGDALTQFGSVLPIGLGVVITVAVAFFAIKVVRGLMHI